ncbi:phage baseplate assembly protein V [Vibrio cortegadensis]|uniref:phage baseplate assembly protein V n=1 Tax=Vibrio cortegadensis TaxID=1328770 RepID=UPI0021C29E56|nr:phage baseplate assembly protein V [Vibrio cortegadensis]MDN3699194.1 phage baseplate assembly protein V [Vibrio cortegadensis]
MNFIKRILSIEKKLRDFIEEFKDLERRVANIIRLGTVQSAYDSTVDVTTSSNLAKGVPFFVPAMGRVKDYRRPTVGEQCILINLGNGDNLNNAVALMGLRSSRFPFPTLNENEVMRDYGGGMKEVYNLDSGSVTCFYPGGMTLHADLTHIGNQEHTGNTNRTGDTISTGQIISTGVFNHAGSFSVSIGAVYGMARSQGASSFSGSLHVLNGDVVVDGYSVKLHHHIGNEGKPTSEAKQ